MQNWDQLVTALVGGGVSLWSGYLAWDAWRRRERWPAAGHVLLAVATVALGIVAAMVHAREP